MPLPVLSVDRLIQGSEEADLRLLSGLFTPTEESGSELAGLAAELSERPANSRSLVIRERRRHATGGRNDPKQILSRDL